jgi:predicted nucleotidyltransferase
LDKSTVLNIINRFGKALESKGIKIEKMILFGSCAKGIPEPESDVDLVVISENFNGKNFWERIDILTDALNEVFEPIEAIAMTPEEWERGDSMICDFARDGKIVY